MNDGFKERRPEREQRWEKLNPNIEVKDQSGTKISIQKDTV